MVNWPAIIKYSTEDELFFIKDESHWVSDKDLHAYLYNSDDLLVDSDGLLFSLIDGQFNSLQKTLAMSEFELWVKDHMV